MTLNKQIALNNGIGESYSSMGDMSIKIISEKVWNNSNTAELSIKAKHGSANPSKNVKNLKYKESSWSLKNQN